MPLCAIMPPLWYYLANNVRPSPENELASRPAMSNVLSRHRQMVIEINGVGVRASFKTTAAASGLRPARRAQPLKEVAAWHDILSIIYVSERQKSASACRPAKIGREREANRRNSKQQAFLCCIALLLWPNREA